MIPKRVYQIWFNKDHTDNIPEDISNYIRLAKQWCKVNGYEHVLIDNNSDVLKECIDNSNFCKYNINSPVSLSDYVRLYMLNKFGGIYIDTDVIIKKGFDFFIGGDYFLGIENKKEVTAGFYRIDVGVMGFSPNSLLLKKLLWLMDNYLCECYINTVIAQYIVPDIPPQDSRYFNKKMWIALPELLPFVINTYLKQDIVYRYEPVTTKYDDNTFVAYDTLFFSWKGKYTDHQFNNTWLK